MLNKAPKAALRQSLRTNTSIAEREFQIRRVKVELRRIRVEPNNQSIPPPWTPSSRIRFYHSIKTTRFPLPAINTKEYARQKQLSQQMQMITSRRSHTSESSIQGTIGKGEAGVGDEERRAVEALVAPEHLNEKERQIWDLLMDKLQCTELEVQDISGGCGSMYGIEVVSEKFRGMNMLKQQRLVNQVLKEEIQGWHGVQLKTRAP